MSRRLIRDPLILLLLVGSSLAVVKNTKTLSLKDGSVLQVSFSHPTGDAYIQRISIAPASNVTCNITNVSSETSFIIAQIHTYQYNVTLSYTEDDLNKVSNNSVFGSNIGLLIRPGLNIMTQLYLKNDNVHHVDALLVGIPYNDKAPVPGGCNMEFNTKIAPYAKVVADDTTVVVDVQPASIPFNNTAQPICEKNKVELEIYQMFLSEQDFTIDSYFIGITNMLTVEDIIQNGRKISGSQALTPMRRVFNAYTGTGSVYAAVAKYGNYSASYVPGFSYACSPLLYPESCQLLTEIFPRLVCAGCFFVGLWAVLRGPFLSIPTFFTGTVIGYVIAEASKGSYNPSANIAIALTIGITFLLLTMCCSITWPLINKLLLTFNVGFFFACVAYFCSPDEFLLVHNSWIFWTLFILLFVIITFLTAISFPVSLPASSAIFSAYMMILPLDYYFGSALKYIIINVIRRMTVKGFEQAVVLPPVQAKDITFIVMWTLFALYAFVKYWLPSKTFGVSEETPLISE
ncbi:transmembrane 7 superfamily member 3-like [Hylaeus volcanicus]|uniref:transmembrane 7 superfamily member 3-like n=1 Tax=Hylaeus volcanicus TaxID=313075 RepID=UPI0023B8100B|nr:transmembrane 7 superfamily member 3-like [Hylaeus volcanicus]